MTKNPFINALAALAYIVGIVSIAFLSGPDSQREPSILFPIAALTLLVLSVSVMAYLFFYQPVLLLLDGKREEAVKLFLHTVGVFACGTLAVLVAVFLFT